MMQRLSFAPGVDTMRSPTTMRGGFVDVNLCRFREGCVEKFLGWAQIIPQAVSGVARTLHFWTDLTDDSWLAIGTNSQLYVYSQTENALYNITPVGWPGGFASSVPEQRYSPMIWSLDNFGQDLVAFPAGGPLYIWSPTIPPNLATIEMNAPAVNQGGFVAMPEEIVVAFGCTPVGGGNADPLLIRWCDVQDITDWTASTTNQAGSFRLSRGSRVVGGISCALGQFLWTDLDIWAMQYEGFPLVFGFTIIGANTGLLSQNAVVAVGSTIYWASDHGFFTLSSSGVAPIPCTVWDKFFENINTAQEAKVIAGANQHHNEVYWFFPSAGGSGEIDSFVSFNYMENLWAYSLADGNVPSLMARTAWTDQNRPGQPLSIDLAGLLIQQGVGVDANGQPMTGVFIQTGYVDAEDGRSVAFWRQFIPDFLWYLSTSDTPSLNIFIYGRNWPGDTPTVIGPFTVTPQTEYLTTRARFREIALRLEMDGLGSWFRMGTNRIMTQVDGRI